MRGTVREHGPDPIDVHVGSQMRLFRTLKAMSQERLADELGVTFQQIQKYERGSNRVSASMLYRAAQALEVPVSAFFEALDGPYYEVPMPAIDRFSVAMFAELDEMPVPVREAIRTLIRTLAKNTPKAR